jgi:hypothetical protein
MQAQQGRPIDKRSYELLSDRPFCRFCPSATVLKWVEPVTNSLSEALPRRVIGADRLTPERMGILGQDRAPFHIIDSLTEPPEGDMMYDGCRRMWPNRVLWGNINLDLYSFTGGRTARGRRCQARASGQERFCV